MTRPHSIRSQPAGSARLRRPRPQPRHQQHRLSLSANLLLNVTVPWLTSPAPPAQHRPRQPGPAPALARPPASPFPATAHDDLVGAGRRAVVRHTVAASAPAGQALAGPERRTAVHARHSPLGPPQVRAVPERRARSGHGQAGQVTGPEVQDIARPHHDHVSHSWAPGHEHGHIPTACAAYDVQSPATSPTTTADRLRFTPTTCFKAGRGFQPHQAGAPVAARSPPPSVPVAQVPAVGGSARLRSASFAAHGGHPHTRTGSPRPASAASSERTLNGASG